MGAETLMGPALFREYFDCSAKEPSGETEESSGSFVGRLEVKHAIALTSFEGTILWAIPANAKRRLFKELDANWLFFSYSRIIVDHSLPTLQVTQHQKSLLNCESQHIYNVLLS
jgi:hypothetical protein